MDQGELLKPRDAARILGVEAQCLSDWRWRRKGPKYVVLSPRAVRYRVADLVEFIQARTVAPESIQAGNGPSPKTDREDRTMPPPE